MSTLTVESLPLDDLELERPLCIFDLEATGVDVDEDRIIQVGVARVEPDRSVYTFEQLVDPGRSVPSEVEELTGITTQELMIAPSFDDVVESVSDWISGSDLAGYNVREYDLPLLQNEFERVGETLPPPDDRSVLDVFDLEKHCRSLALEAVYERYVGTEMKGAHEALADVIGTAEIFSHQLEEFDIPTAVDEIVDEMADGYIDQKRRLYRDEEGMVRVDFGKFQSENRSIAWIAENEPGYLGWMLEEIDDLRPHFKERLDELDISVSKLKRLA